MTLPDETQRLIDVEVQHLAGDRSYDLSPITRFEVYKSLGPSAYEDTRSLAQIVSSRHLPVLSIADRVRARAAILTAQRVSTLWGSACDETNRLNAPVDETGDTLAEHQEYLLRLQASSFDDCSVYKVPRTYVVDHILAMAELAMGSKVNDHDNFLRQVNEWWGIYPNPWGCHREFSIKWAAQEALYLTVLWQEYLRYREGEYDIHTEDLNEYVNRQTDAPAGFAMLAYAGVFDQDDRIVDPERRRKFWLWWLSWAIPTADMLESK